MRKPWRVLWISVAIIIVLLTVTRFLGLWAFGRVAGISMSPSLKKGEFFIAVKPLSLQHQEIVAYETEEGPDISLGRIIGISGDTIDVKNGLIYRNNTFIDDTVNLEYTYWAAISEFVKVPATNKLVEEGRLFTKTDSFSVNLSPGTISENKIIGRRASFARDIDLSKFNLNDDPEATADDFGPFVVPAGMYFILSDNRGNSYDSRHRGFIPREKILFIKL